MKLFQIRITRAAFDKIPEDERTMLVLLAHVANEFNVLVRLFHWSVAADDNSPIEEKANNVLILTVIRLFTGKLSEAWKLLQQTLFASKLAKTYEAALSQHERDELAYLKQYFGKKNIIDLVRNGYAFHYSPEQVKASYAAVPDDEHLDMYLSNTDLNSLFYFGDAIANRALLHEINPVDHQAAMDTLQSDTTRVHRAFHAVLTGLVSAAVKTHIGETLEEMGATDVSYSPRFTSEELCIPYFVEVPK